jgi:hypothetical protein
MLNPKGVWWFHDMRSEIPQLEVITAIHDSESEDFVSQLLFSQGWNIIYRAFDADSLIRFMHSRGSELRTVIIYMSDLPNFDSSIFGQFSTNTITFISLDEIELSSHIIMSQIRGQLRLPMVQSKQNISLQSKEEFQTPHFQERSQRGNSQKIIIRTRRVIAVTGSSGAPGRTRFAILLAEELADKNKVMLIDADMRSQGLSRQRDLIRTPEIQIIPLSAVDRPRVLPMGDETTVVDLGTLPAISEAVSDRRWHGSLINNVLDSATHLVYLVKSTPPNIDELSMFLREFPVLAKKLPVTYVCVLAGHSRELREWEGKFLTLTTGESRYILRESQLERDIDGSGLPFMKVGNSKRKEIAKIALSLS